MSPLFLFRIWTVSLLVAIPFTMWMEWVQENPPTGNLTFAILSSLSSICVVFSLVMEKRVWSQERFSYEKRIRALTTEYERENGRIQRSLNEAVGKIGEAQKRVKDVRESNENLRGELEDAEHENLNYQSEIDSLNRKLRIEKGEKEQFEWVNGRLGEMVDELRKEKLYWRGKAGAEQYWKKRYKKEKIRLDQLLGKCGKERAHLRSLLREVGERMEKVIRITSSYRVKSEIVSIRQKMMNSNINMNVAQKEKER